MTAAVAYLLLFTYVRRSAEDRETDMNNRNQQVLYREKRNGICSQRTSFHFEAPYPQQYEEWITIQKGKKVFLRPVKPNDGPRILDLISRLSRSSRYFRFLRHIDTLRPEILHKLVHLDYKKEFALAAVICEGGKNVIVAVCRYTASFDPSHGESAIVVRDDWHGKGLGKAMTKRVFKIAEENGLSTMGVHFDPNNEIAKNLYAGLGYLYQYRQSFVDVSDSIEIQLSKFAL
jgi:GNAT superfamily N-acetyltransferase